MGIESVTIFQTAVVEGYLQVVDLKMSNNGEIYHLDNNYIIAITELSKYDKYYVCMHHYYSLERQPLVSNQPQPQARVNINYYASYSHA